MDFDEFIEHLVDYDNNETQLLLKHDNKYNNLSISHTQLTDNDVKSDLNNEQIYEEEKWEHNKETKSQETMDFDGLIENLVDFDDDEIQLLLKRDNKYNNPSNTHKHKQHIELSIITNNETDNAFTEKK
eukprot:475925_1